MISYRIFYERPTKGALTFVRGANRSDFCRSLLTPTPVALFNGIFQSRFPDEVKVLEQLNKMRERNFPFYWTIWPLSAPHNLRNILKESGMKSVHASPCMRFSDTRVPAFKSPLEVHQVLTAVDQENWIRVFAETFQFSPLACDHFRAWIAKKNSSELAHFVGAEANNAGVACSTAFRFSGGGFIFNVATDKNFRKKGFGFDISLAALRWLRECGAKEVYLMSSPEGLSVYKALGFETLFSVETLVWEP